MNDDISRMSKKDLEREVRKIRQKPMVTDRLTELEEENTRLKLAFHQASGVAAYAKLVEEKQVLQERMQKWLEFIQTISPPLPKTADAMHTETGVDGMAASGISSDNTCLATATIWVTDDPLNPNGGWSYVKLPVFLFPNDIKQFSQEVPRLIAGILARNPTSEDLPPRWQDFGIPDKEFFGMLGELMLCKHESRAAFQKRQLEYFHHYKEAIETNKPNQSLSVFQKLIKDTFDKYEKRLDGLNQQFQKWDRL